MDYCPDNNFNPVLTESYNKIMTTAYEEARDFILLHYQLSQRKESAFWRDFHDITFPDSLKMMLGLYNETGILPKLKIGVFPHASYYHILSGNGHLPKRSLPMVNVSDMSEVKIILDKLKENNLQIVSSTPLYSDGLKPATN